MSQIHKLCREGNVEALRLELSTNAYDVDLKENGATALHYACGDCDEDVVASLLDAGASVTETDLYGNTALHIACMNNNCVGICRRLILAGAILSTTDADGNTPLHLACMCENFEISIMIVQNGGNLALTDNVRIPDYIAIHKNLLSMCMLSKIKHLWTTLLTVIYKNSFW